MKVEFEWKKDFSTLVSEKTGGSDGLLFWQMKQHD